MWMDPQQESQWAHLLLWVCLPEISYNWFAAANGSGEKNNMADISY